MAGALAGCTSPAESADTPTPQSGEAAEVAAPEVSAPVTRVAGRLPDRDRLALRRQVEELVSRYVLAAFVDPATAPADRFPGFTEGATRLARTQGAVLSRADLEEAGEPVVVQVVRVEAPVNVLAPRGRPAGATARLDLTLEVASPEDDTASASASGSPTASTSGPERVRLQGRLLLTPVGQSWRVFGFDVRRTDR
ncbi:hypothetical protein G7072_12920 [Nocardioides sp. HDW12B]|uniref:hypothetical protein n=1 Tax=Nocardioides sp. HDW12B TaxID=2714939 RepID=UPI001409D51B|nr:hypothetical protein [Nocardioides sp. HDW12B]QIK67125.1 hypothetical protein G7072_12920 [Nocardioides sp. HDW12B]